MSLRPGIEELYLRFIAAMIGLFLAAAIFDAVHVSPSTMFVIAAVIGTSMQILVTIFLFRRGL